MKPYRGLVLLLLGIAVPALAADVSGEWLFVFETEAGERRVPFTLKVEGTKVSGTMAGDVAVEGAFEDGVLTLQFPFFSDDAGFTSDLKIRGTLEEGGIRGGWTFGEHSGAFRATRP
jgi:hypothetical protein